MTSVIKIQPVILCGGAGTRLWPLSRSGFPKQFLSFHGKESLLQQSAQRLTAIASDGVEVSQPFVVTGEEQSFVALEQMREVGVETGLAIVEPESRNTAPALTLAALAATANGEDPVLVVVPADHAVDDIEAFALAMQRAACCAVNGSVVVLGVRPDRPETDYGYIFTDPNIDSPFVEVQRFIEKPNLNKAQEYFEVDGYYWNAGIFVMRASVWLRAINIFRPDIHKATELAWDNRTEVSSSDAVFLYPGSAEFAAVPAESIDFAVMEQCPGNNFVVCMVALEAGWSDLGGWTSISKSSPSDENGNSCLGDVLIVETSGSLVHSTSRLVSLVGVTNLVVIETPDAVLVADKMNRRGVISIIDQLRFAGREEHKLHRKVYKPWGWYDSVEEGENFKVKRIHVNPGARLSLQKHRYRAENWVVVRGVANVINGDKLLTLSEQQSTYIPLGAVHRLINPGDVPLEIIEVQSGEYLGEDDIVRLEDDYARV